MNWRPLFRWPGGILAQSLWCLICGVSLAVPVAAQSPIGLPQTLDFDGTVGAGNPDVTGLEVGPWLFASQKFHTVSRSDAGLFGFADNGTPYIASVGGGLDYPITLERADGSPFSLITFDAAEGFLDDLLAAEEGFVGASTIEVEAALLSGVNLTLQFDLDGLRDGPDGVDDFETFVMPDDLHSVTSVTFTGLNAARRDAGFALDNATVAVVPEPNGAVLAVLAAVLCGAVGAVGNRGSRTRVQRR